MLGSGSLQGDYVLVSSFDESLDLPGVPFAPVPFFVEVDGEPEDLAALRKERARRYEAAINSGRAQQLVKDGEKASLFTFRATHGAALTWLRGEIERQRLGLEEQWELAFRLAIKEVANTPKPIEIKRRVLELPGRTISLATEKSIEPLYDIGRDAGEPELGRAIVLELGAIVTMRAKGVRPLS